ncbi:MAG TPA: DUF2264 domain-containing protein [Kutzneria sp.]|nr:DUF2264 domain-containing protein [Kutzneria sp.]
MIVHPAPSRAEWERLADSMLLAVRPWATDTHALIHLPGPVSGSGRWSDGLEGYARTFLLAAFRLAGAGGDDPQRIAEWYAQGLAAGVDPADPDRWPRFGECKQAKVEAASIALGLHLTRPWLWDRLSTRTQQGLLDWLAPMVGDDMPQNNWLWFQAVTGAFARSVGGAWSQADFDHAIESTDRWHAGEGWYSDGLSGGEHRNFDHYSGWAMHFYPLLFCDITGDDELALRYRKRLRLYLSDYARLIGGNGSPLIQGRSLTYRFAALAPLWIGARYDATPLEPGLTRRIGGLMLDHFLNAGAVDHDGLLTLGWHGRFPAIRQMYSGPASPYWASKGFAGLLLPATHEVWSAPEVPLPVEEEDFECYLPAPGWTVSGTRADGVVRVLNHGSDHIDPAEPATDDPAYARIAYSTHAAPEMTPPLDSSATLVDADGRAAHRRPLTAVQPGVSRSRAHWPADESWNPFHSPETTYRLGPWITVASVIHGATEVRLVRVDEAAECTHPGPWRLRIGGWATVPGSGLHSDLVDLAGLVVAETVVGKDTNPLGPVSEVPVLFSAGEVEVGRIYAAAVHLGGSPLEALPELDITASAVEVRWPDGRVDRVAMPPV